MRPVASNRNRVLFFLVLTIWLAAFIYPPGTRWGGDWDVQSVTGIADENTLLDQNLPYKVYRQKEDSLKHAQFLENRKYNRGSTYQIGGLGISSNDENPSQPYSFFLNGYRLKDHVSFVHRNNRTFLRYPVWDTVIQRNGLKEQSGHLEEKQVALTFFPDQKKAEVPDSGSVAFPTSKTTATILKALLMVGAVVFLILGLYCLLFIPIKILSLISKGQFFNDELTGGLYITGGFLLLLGLIHPLTAIPLHLVFSSRVPDGVEFSYYEVLMKHWELVVAGGIILLFAQAFSKGTQLQNEQDLTV